jgi:hypothetical protein
MQSWPGVYDVDDIGAIYPRDSKIMLVEMRE